MNRPAVIQLHLFGAATPTGEACRQQAFREQTVWPVVAYSRRPEAAHATSHRADFSDPASFYPVGEPGQPAIWISFAPI